MGLFGETKGTSAHEEMLLDKKIPRDLHITKVLNQHPFHPYNPDMPADHVCAPNNTEFEKCLSSQDEAVPLYMRHVNCFDMKSQLMVCLVREKKRLRALEEGKAQQ